MTEAGYATGHTATLAPAGGYPLTRRSLAAWPRWREASGIGRRMAGADLQDAEISGLERLEQNLRAAGPRQDWFLKPRSNSATAHLTVSQAALQALTKGLFVRNHIDGRECARLLAEACIPADLAARRGWLEEALLEHWEVPAPPKPARTAVDPEHDLVRIEIGQVFDRWTVLAVGEGPQRNGRYWVCRCVCGAEKTLRERHLRQGETTGCNTCRKPFQNTSAVNPGARTTMTIYGAVERQVKRRGLDLTHRVPEDVVAEIAAEERITAAAAATMLNRIRDKRGVSRQTPVASKGDATESAEVTEPAVEEPAEERQEMTTALAESVGRNGASAETLRAPEGLSGRLLELWNAIARHGCDPRESVPSSVRQRVASELDIVEGTVNGGINRLRKKLAELNALSSPPPPPEPRQDEPRPQRKWQANQEFFEEVIRLLADRGIDLTAFLPNGVSRDLAAKLGVSESYVQMAAREYRQGRRTDAVSALQPQPAPKMHERVDAANAVRIEDLAPQDATGRNETQPDATPALPELEQVFVQAHLDAGWDQAKAEEPEPAPLPVKQDAPAPEPARAEPFRIIPDRAWLEPLTQEDRQLALLIAAGMTADLSGVSISRRTQILALSADCCALAVGPVG